MNSKILTLKDKNEWTSLLKLLPPDQQDIYFTPEYYSLYEFYGDGKAMCFVFEKDGDIALYPFLLNSVNELGYDLDDDYYDIQGVYGYNGVISSSYSKPFVKEFHDKFNSFCKDNKIIAEFTRFHPLLNNYKFSNHYHQVIFDRKTILLNLAAYKTFDQIWDISYSKEARKNCRKAKKQGLSFTIAKKISEYESFYLLYVNTMKFIGAGKYYYFSLDFFKGLFDNMKSSHKLILIWCDMELVGGFILFHFGRYAHNYLSSGSTKYRNLNINEYMQNVVIKIAFEEKCNMLHFGGGNSNEVTDPLFKFKSKFSNDRGDFFIGKKIHNKKVYEQVVNQWKHTCPDSHKIYKNKLLGYREITNG